MIGDCPRSVRKRMTEYGLYIRDTFSDITDRELDGFISDIHHEFPMCGNRLMTGHLQACGFRIQQHRIRERELLHAGFILFIVISMLLLMVISFNFCRWHLIIHG